LDDLGEEGLKSLEDSLTGKGMRRKDALQNGPLPTAARNAQSSRSSANNMETISDVEDDETDGDIASVADRSMEDDMFHFSSPTKQQHNKKRRPDVNQTFIEVEFQKKEAKRYEIDSSERLAKMRMEMEKEEREKDRQHALEMARMKQESKMAMWSAFGRAFEAGPKQQSAH